MLILRGIRVRCDHPSEEIENLLGRRRVIHLSEQTRDGICGERGWRFVMSNYAEGISILSCINCNLELGTVMYDKDLQIHHCYIDY